jgi:ubiquinone/menaquinone biosynthesis C-methylase UbiE
VFDSIAQSFDEIADQYDSTGAQFTETIAARVVELADLVPGENVLDLGCGTGEVTNRAAKAVAPDGHVTGIDLSPRMLERAWAESRKQGVSHRVTLRPGDAASPHAEAASFDAVLASLVLYLLPDPDAALKAWYDLLVLGG